LLDNEEDGLRWSQSARGSSTCEELAPANTKRAAKGFRVGADAGVAVGVCLRETGMAGSPSSTAPPGGDGGGEEGAIFRANVGILLTFFEGMGFY
jgi:hypothetical protein